MKRKRFGVGGRQDESGRGASCWTNRPEDIGPLVAQIARAASILASPKSASACLGSTDSRFVLEPDFQRLTAGVLGTDAIVSGKFF
jgi:hypothetical protein